MCRLVDVWSHFLEVKKVKPENRWKYKDCKEAKQRGRFLQKETFLPKGRSWMTAAWGSKLSVCSEAASSSWPGPGGHADESPLGNFHQINLDGSHTLRNHIMSQPQYSVK
ncbi:hypothetical protein P7K49_033742 [Saguinus oedipus]|uniref:Uncharacterized protein n=1 Tax=Saguinus oedipus TaxID=9490 RepID=A0ABQ9TTM5_SAGOE|nr:hypothetical protein P7K49_033742 [Saguinus oedipus]